MPKQNQSRKKAIRKKKTVTKKGKAGKGSRTVRHSGAVKLSATQKQEYRAWSNAGFEKRKQTPARRALAGRVARRQFIIVAEGDSWFDYKPAYLEKIGAKDLLGHLQTSGRINIWRVSHAGDTLENMIYGTDTIGSGTQLAPKLPPQIDKTLEAIRDKNADAFFFSGGGNDLAGVELGTYLNHKDSGQPVLREAALDYVFGAYFDKALADLIGQVHLIKPGLPIFLQGYDYAVPDGRKVRLLGFPFAGPWLKPALIQKRYVDLSQGRRIMVDVLDRFNAALARVAAAHQDVYFIKLLGTLRTTQNYQLDWANELHPTSDGFKTLSAGIEREILAVLEGS